MSMNESELSKTLLNKAKVCGLCEEWTNAWGKPDKQGLINKWMQGIDFAIKNNYPSLDFIKQNFEKELLHKNNIYVDEDVHCRSIKHKSVLCGKCNGLMMFDGFDCCNIFVRHDSFVTIDCRQMSKVFISVYDNAKVKVLQYDTASVYVYLHGDSCTAECKGDVNLRKSSK